MTCKLVLGDIPPFTSVTVATVSHPTIRFRNSGNCETYFQDHFKFSFNIISLLFLKFRLNFYEILSEEYLGIGGLQTILKNRNILNTVVPRNLKLSEQFKSN